MKKSLLSSLVAIVVLISCSPQKNATAVKETKQQAKAKIKSIQTGSPDEQAVLWQQTSAEYTALCHQAFNAAKTELSYTLDFRTLEKPPIIIMDLDETVLDNSPYNGYLSLNGKEFTEDSWKDWTQLAQAKAVPGALEFIKFASSSNVPIYYISNRSHEDLQVTIRNMNDIGIPVSEDRVFLKQEGYSKSSFRDGLRNQYEIILLIGDNLADFEEVFERQLSISERKGIADGMKESFGRKFIVLPNILYGDWQKTLENGDPTMIYQEDREGASRYIQSFERITTN